MPPVLHGPQHLVFVGLAKEGQESQYVVFEFLFQTTASPPYTHGWGAECKKKSAGLETCSPVGECLQSIKIEMSQRSDRENENDQTHGKTKTKHGGLELIVV